MREQRRLAAIVSADVAGYSRLMGRDESGTLAALKVLRREVVDPPIAAHGGRIVKTTGDGLLLEFSSVVDAVRCVVEIQTAMAARSAAMPEYKRIDFRIGVNLGDIIIDGDDIFGDGVNIAARLESIAEPGGVCLSDDAYRQIRGKIDLAFEDLGPQTLKNIAQSVSAWHLRFDKGADPTAKAPLALPEKPSIAVLPFQNMSGDPEQEYFTDGIVEDIITELSRFRELLVIARNSTFTYKGKPANVAQVARELGVRYVLEGSSRKAGNRVRVTAQLIDADTGSHLWAERYDRELSDIFAVQEQVTRAIVQNLVPAIESSGLARIRRRVPANLTAEELATRAWAENNAAYLSGKRALREAAAATARQALALDPECVRAWTTLALLAWQDDFYSGGRGAVERCKAGLDAARRAIALDRLEHRAYMAKGLLLVQLREYDEALADLRHACELNPNDAVALNSLAWGEVADGDGRSAKEHLLQYLRLSPRDPARYNACVVLANACSLTGDYAEGLHWIAESRREQPDFPPAISVGIKLLVATGNIDKARAEAERVPRTRERVLAGSSQFRRPEDRERELRLLRIAFGIAEPVAEGTGPTLALPDKPSIAVLPFENMSGDPEQEYFADGMVEDIITALSRFKSLFVIARNSSFTYKGRAVDIKQVARELGVRYVLEGSVRRAGRQLRITGQLIDAETGTHLWADRFDSLLDDVFALQDQMTMSVVGAIALKLDQAEMDRARRKPVENLDAYDCFLRGMAQANTRTKEGNEEALRLFYRAMELDPEFATPYGMAARCYSTRKQQSWVVNEDWEKAETSRLAARVSAIGQDDALALCWSGYALVWVNRDYDSGVALVDQALAINPNLAVGWANRGPISLFLGQPAAAEEQLARAIRLNPLDPEIYRPVGAMAFAHLFQGRTGEALEWASKALVHRPTFYVGLWALAVANAIAGNIDEARKVMVQIRQVHPAMRLSNFREYLPIRRSEDMQILIEGLRLAGLPE